MTQQQSNDKQQVHYRYRYLASPLQENQVAWHLTPQASLCLFRGLGSLAPSTLSGTFASISSLWPRSKEVCEPVWELNRKKVEADSDDNDEEQWHVRPRRLVNFPENYWYG